MNFSRGILAFFACCVAVLASSKPTQASCVGVYANNLTGRLIAVDRVKISSPATLAAHQDALLAYFRQAKLVPTNCTNSYPTKEESTRNAVAGVSVRLALIDEANYISKAAGTRCNRFLRPYVRGLIAQSFWSLYKSDNHIEDMADALAMEARVKAYGKAVSFTELPPCCDQTSEERYMAGISKEYAAKKDRYCESLFMAHYPGIFDNPA